MGEIYQGTNRQDRTGGLMGRGWHGEPRRHADAARGIKTAKQKRNSARKVYYDKLGVRVRDVSIVKGLDAGVADVVQVVNDAGFKTNMSSSGLEVDYRRATDYVEGWLSFWEKDVTNEQIEQLRRAAQKAGMRFEDRTDELWFDPSFRDQKGRLVGTRTGIVGVWIGAYKGEQVSDTEIVRRWKKFVKELTGRDVQVG